MWSIGHKRVRQRSFKPYSCGVSVSGNLFLTSIDNNREWERLRVAQKLSALLDVRCVVVMWDVLWCCEMLSFVVDLFHNGQQLSATWSATTDIIQIQGILREEDESDLIWLFFWLCPHLRGYGMNFARWYSSLDLMNILCYNIQDSISLGYSSGSIECEGWRQHSWKRLINNVSEVCFGLL